MHHFQTAITPVTLCILLVTISSCTHLEHWFESDEEHLTQADEQETVFVEPDPEPEQKPVVDRPDWFDPNQPVTVRDDSVYITVSAVAADSAEAHSIADQTAAEFGHTAFTLIIDDVLEDPDRHGFGSLDINNTHDLISLLTFDGKRAAVELSYQEREFCYQSGDNVRFYLKRIYHRDDMIKALRLAFAPR